MMDERITTIFALASAAVFGYAVGWKHGIEIRGNRMQKLEQKYA